MKIEIGNLKSAKEALSAAQYSLAHSKSSLSDTQIIKIGQLIQEIDKLRPIGSNGEHGNLHTPWCGCEDTPFKFCKNCERVIVYGAITMDTPIGNKLIDVWVHEHNGKINCFEWIRTECIATPMLEIEA